MSPSPAHDAFLVYAAAWFKVEVPDVIGWLSKKDQPVYAVLGNMQQMFVLGWQCGQRAAQSEGANG
jgi:hypothetical protein